jgi:hypothetical protein
MDLLNASWPSPKGEVADPKCGPQNVVNETGQSGNWCGEKLAAEGRCPELASARTDPQTEAVSQSHRRG